MSIEKNDLNVLEDGNNNWKEKKEDSMVIANSFLRLAKKLNINTFYNISEYMFSCGKILEFKLFEDGTKKLHNAMFCRNRLCAMCNWRRSKKVFGQVSKIVQEIDKTNEYEYVFLTLTLKNCGASELKNNVDLISNGFRRMIDKNKKVKNMCQGYFRGIEITYNKKDNTYHPHIHCIIAVKKNYFSKYNIGYIKTEEWAEIWQSYLKVDYLPIVDIRKVKDKRYKAVAEVSKYTVKSKDIIIKNKNGKINEELTDNNIYNLHFALKNKRLVSFGGIMKDIHKQLNLDDVNNDTIDLIHTDVDDDNNILNYIILIYKWNIGITNYKLVKMKKEP